MATVLPRVNSRNAIGVKVTLPPTSRLTGLSSILPEYLILLSLVNGSLPTNIGFVKDILYVSLSSTEPQVDPKSRRVSPFDFIKE